MRAEVARVIRGYRHASAALVGTDELPRFGPFQAVRLIGRGGMGAVYLAERADGEFRMQVAVKVVAGRFLSPVLEDNFRRERQILAGLNHPNIARLLDGGMRDGAPYLVMEYVDGLRLDQYCDRQGLGMGQRVELLGAVCRAVEYAHAANVVHRDLKPSNILVTADGTVKLLDFGSSKLIETQAVATDQTVTAFRGYTPEFSSPEQMEGRPTGTAADVYSLGVLLAKLCPEDRRAADVTARATVRDPAKRQPSVTAFREELEQLLAPGGRPPFRWTASRIGGAIAIVALAAALALLFLWRKKANVTAFDDAYVRLSPVGARWRNASISADGKWLAYSSDQAQANNFDIWLRGLNEDGTGRRLTSGPERDVETSISLDGRYVAFYSDRKPPGIYRIEVATGRTELLAQDGRTPKYSPDGRWIAYAGSARSAADKFAASPRRRVRVMPASSGLPVDVSEGLLSAGDPVWTKDGSELLFESYRDNALVDRWAVPAGKTLGARELRAKGEPPGGDAQPCAMRDSQGGAYTYPDGNRGKSLWVAAAGSNLALRDPSPRTFGGMIRDCSAARNGVIVVEGTDSRSTVWQQDLDPQSGSLRGELKPVRTHTPVYRGPSLSWDGRWMTYQTADGAIFLNDLELARELSYPSGGSGPPLLSGDGRLLWSNEMDGVLAAKSRDAGALRRDDRAYQASMLWGASDAGSRLLVYKASSNPRAISLIDTEANRTTTILSHPQWNLYGGNFSPDDRWVVFEAQTPDGAAIYVAPFRGSAPIPGTDWILIGAGEDPKWSADGASVFALRYTDGFGCVWRIPVDAADKRPAGSAQGLVHFHGKWSPRFLVPGYFRIAAARNRMAFLLGEQDEVVWRRRNLLR